MTHTCDDDCRSYGCNHKPDDEDSEEEDDDPCNSCVLYGEDCVTLGRTPPCQKGDDTE